MSIFERFKSDNSEVWTAYINHQFVLGLAQGTLPKKSFKKYLGQDYLFLIHFARAYALAAYKSDTIEDIKQAASGLSAIINLEMDMHIEYCKEWGISEETMQNLSEATETLAYTRFVLEKGLSGDLLDLHVALAPCLIGYAEIGKKFQDKVTQNPYGSWIKMYASEEYQSAAIDQMNQLEKLAAGRGGEERFTNLSKTFNQATRLEIDFWEMGLSAQ